VLFTDLNLSEATLKGVTDAGYNSPTPIQEQAIPVLLAGQDMCATAQTGTGKTASFVLPLLDILGRGRAKARMPRALIMEPTRELAQQVADDLTLYGKHHKVNYALLIGGESMGDQEKALGKGADIIIATPGRLLDFLEKGKILLNDMKIFVIDEADRMLDMGFIPDIEKIAKILPASRQTALLSATMPKPIRALAAQFMRHPIEIAVSPPATTATTITQYQVKVAKQEIKRQALRHVIKTEDIKQAIIFCNRKRDVDELHRSMVRHGFKAGALHGDITQSLRNETLENFKTGAIDFLMASDVAARGLDIDSLPYVINFDVPIHADDYVHRIGRTGRAGKEGKAFTLVTPKEKKFMDAIVEITKKELTVYDMSGFDGKDIPSKSTASKASGRSTPKNAPAKTSVTASKESEPTVSGLEPTSDAVQSPRTPAPRPARTPRPASPNSSSPKPSGRDHNRHERERDRDDDKPVKGFGDETPAFFQ